VLAPQPLREVPTSLEGRLSLLMEHLRDRRALLVLDNLETLLEEGESRGRLRSGYEGYGQLLRRVGETTHQGCLLLTSREKLTDLEPLEGSRRPVRTLRLDGLETAPVSSYWQRKKWSVLRMTGSAWWRCTQATPWP
jgi:hypothetical protein